ncbi:MAG: DUF1028 domain-containing protein [Actinomycetota bacterium]|nr:DUF1028 domain-containing protein [Actinomycetota bacterium]
MLAPVSMSPLTADRARPGTYSIVARDAETGELGVAVQSHWFSVGPIVPWAQAGVGAVATQANVEVAYGPRGLELLASGSDARSALDQLVAEDPQADSRQVAIIDAAGSVAAHTGASCMAFAGHCRGVGVSCQANIMASEGVWPAMLEAYVAHRGTLAQRLLVALDAGEAAGGDLRGRQSAALLVVPGHGRDWDTVVSLRVEDHPQPLEELRRLARLHEAYALAGQGDERLAEGRHDEAAALYLQASECAPESDELQFWAGLGAAATGDLEAGMRHIEAALAVQPNWGELLSRLPPELAPAAPAVLARLKSESG